MKRDLLFKSSSIKPLSSVFANLNIALKTTAFESLLNASKINQLMSFNDGYQPRSQASFGEDLRYYEQIIFDDKTIPTRDNSWHDFFNAYIWSTFPKSKAFLNQQHVTEIEQYGLNPRTKLRNKITLFDECGVILLTTNRQLKDAFEKQNWQMIFQNSEVNWFVDTLPVVFGHAIYEMLLQPFLGLTGKVLVVEVDDIDVINRASDPSVLDELLIDVLKTKEVLKQDKPFYPFPILGVPGWYIENQDDAFYANEQYFMPKRSSKRQTK